MELKILRPQDTDRILAFENKKLEMQMTDPDERQFAAWSAKWRRESLEHHLPQGWSFCAETADSELLGYFIAQPFLFFQGFTQVLWVEWLSADRIDVRSALIEVAYRWCRDKHLQKVIFAEGLVNEKDFATLPFNRVNWSSFDMNTTRMNV